MNITSIFNVNPNIVINTDIDGFLCGWLLCKYCDCNIVGFSNSKDCIWMIPTVKDIYEPIYIDLYVNNKDTFCIEQHIITSDNVHREKINNNKINPNLLREGRNFYDDYFNKYPFGTFHFLVGLLEKEGINVTLPNLNIEYTFGNEIKSTLGEIVLRADDALYSTFKYEDNARDWWRWLYDYSNHSESIKTMALFAYGCDKNNIDEQKKRTGEFFKKGFGCDGNDGAFNNITDVFGNIKPSVTNFWNCICNMMGDEDFVIPTEYTIHKGSWEKMNFGEVNSNELNELLNREDLFSYAFIYGSKSSYPNFSATFNMT